jgi:hypothetical protein
VTRARRRFVRVLGALGIVLMLGGGLGVALDANARAADASAVVEELTAYYEDEEGYELGAQASVERSIIVDSIANDGPKPQLFTDSRQDYAQANYGAFGGIFSYIPLQRPWAPRLLTTPVAVGAVLLATALLIVAAGWTPRRRDPSA